MKTCGALADIGILQGHTSEGLEGEEDIDTEDGDDNGSGRQPRRARKEAAAGNSAMQAAMPGMALGPAEMMQLQAAGMMLPQQFWAGALAGLEGHDADVRGHALDIFTWHCRVSCLETVLVVSIICWVF